MTAEVPECRECFYPDGRLQARRFWLNGKLCNTDGPAVEDLDPNGRLVRRVFWVNDTLHKTDGPAVEYWNDQGQLTYHAFYVNGEKLTEEDFRAWQERQQRKRELRALVFALEHKFPAEAPEREFLRHILPAHVAGEAAT